MYAVRHMVLMVHLRVYGRSLYTLRKFITKFTSGRVPTRIGLGRHCIVQGLMSPSPTWRDLRYKRDPPGGPKGSNLIANTSTTAYGVEAYRSQVVRRSNRTCSITTSSVSSSSAFPSVICGFHHIIPYQKAITYQGAWTSIIFVFCLLDVVLRRSSYQRTPVPSISGLRVFPVDSCNLLL